MATIVTITLLIESVLEIQASKLTTIFFITCSIVSIFILLISKVCKI